MKLIEDLEVQGDGEKLSSDSDLILPLRRSASAGGFFHGPEGFPLRRSGAEGGTEDSLSHSPHSPNQTLEATSFRSAARGASAHRWTQG